MTPQHPIKHASHQHPYGSSRQAAAAVRQIQQPAGQISPAGKRKSALLWLRSLASALIFICGLAGTQVFAGPVILGGDDLDLHGNYNNGSGPAQKGWLYIQRALESMYKGGCLARPGNDGSIAVLGAPVSTLHNGNNVGGGDAGAAIHYAGNVGLGKVVNYYDGVAGINAFFAGLASGTINPAIIYIPSGHAVNGITTAEGAALTAGANDLKNFVNSGGGLMAHISTTSTTGWVTTVTGVTVNLNVCNYSGATLTAAGSTAFPALSNSDIAAGPCHATFSGTLGGLSVLALDGATPKGNLIIGGGCGTTISTASCAEFNATTACRGTATEFTDISTGATSWNWNFGDGATSTQQNPTHIYANAGTYTATLSVNGGACVVTHTVTVTASPPAPAIIGPASSCTKTATYCVTRAPGVNYTWNVTNGTATAPTITATQSCITVTWNATGNGMVTVTATGGETCCSSMTKLLVQACEDYCCADIRGNAVLTKPPSHLGGSLYSLSPTLSAAVNVVRVTATVISTTQTFTSGSGCGTGGPVNSYIRPPLSSVTGFTSSLPVANGREEIWSSSTGVNIGSGVDFPFNIQLPPLSSGPAGECSDVIRFCVKYTFTDEKCHTCEIIRCYEISRTGGLPSDLRVREVQ